MYDAANVTDGAIWWIGNYVELHHLQFMHLTCLHFGQLGILLKSVATFFLPPIKNPNTIYLGHVHIKWTLHLTLKSLAKQVYMQSNIGDSTASYIVNAVKCKMLLNVRCC